MKKILIVVLVVTAGLFAASPRFDDKGWIPHRQRTRVLLNGDWMAGETRLCDAYANNVTSPKVDYLSCVVGVPEIKEVSPHELRVTYWGKISGRKIFILGDKGYRQLKWQWNCERKSERLVCRAAN